MKVAVRAGNPDEAPFIRDPGAAAQLLKRSRKIVVTGNSGSGKSTFAVALAQALGLPVIHLDGLYWHSPDDPYFPSRHSPFAPC